MALMYATGPALARVSYRELEPGSATSATTTVLLSSGSWYSSALRAFDAMANLPVGWDGQGSPAPQPKALGALAIVGAIQHPAVPEPDIVPGAGGEVILIWRHLGRRLELHFAAPDEFGVLRVAVDGALQEFWLDEPSPAAIRAHLVWLLTGEEWQ